MRKGDGRREGGGRRRSWDGHGRLCWLFNKKDGTHVGTGIVVAPETRGEAGQRVDRGMGMSVCTLRIFPSVLKDPALHPTHIVTYSVFPPNAIPISRKTPAELMTSQPSGISHLQWTRKTPNASLLMKSKTRIPHPPMFYDSNPRQSPPA